MWFIVQVYNIATPMAITLKVVVCIHNYMVLIEDFFLYESLIFSLDLVIVILFCVIFNPFDAVYRVLFTALKP